MTDQHAVSLKGVTAANNQEVILSYIRAAKEIKAKSQEEVACLTQVLKDRNFEIRTLKNEAVAAKNHIDKHNAEFKTFRNILSELKTLAVDGGLNTDVVYGPEIMSLKKEKDKYEALYKHEFDNRKKFEARSTAMSAQVIERQRKIFKLEAMLIESEEKRLQLEAQLKTENMEDHSLLSGNHMDAITKKIRESFTSLQRLVQTN